jgi:hypothetical protein
MTAWAPLKDLTGNHGDINGIYSNNGKCTGVSQTSSKCPIQVVTEYQLHCPGADRCQSVSIHVLTTYSPQFKFAPRESTFELSAANMAGSRSEINFTCTNAPAPDLIQSIDYTSLQASCSNFSGLTQASPGTPPLRTFATAPGNQSTDVQTLESKNCPSYGIGRLGLFAGQSVCTRVRGTTPPPLPTPSPSPSPLPSPSPSPSVGPNGSFIDQTDVPINSTITSNNVLLGNIAAGSTATCTNCTAISRNGGAFSAPPFHGFQPGDTITVRMRSASTNLTQTIVNVRVGGTFNSDWKVTTGICTPGSATLVYTGSMQEFVVPGACSALDVVLKGAGGAANLGSMGDRNPAGSGGMTQATITEAGRRTFQVLVGAKGVDRYTSPLANNHNIGGGGTAAFDGGGMSALLFGGQYVLIAGGGGGGGSAGRDDRGGDGGGVTGRSARGYSWPIPCSAATGGTQTAGGRHSSCTMSVIDGNTPPSEANKLISDGSQYQGGTVGYYDSGSGGGGGGYYGGAAGAQGGCGGGGSGYSGGIPLFPMSNVRMTQGGGGKGGCMDGIGVPCPGAVSQGGVGGYPIRQPEDGSVVIDFH